MRKHTLRSLLASLAPGIFSTVIFLAFLELVVGRFVPAPDDLFRPSPSNCVQRDPLLGTSFRPDCEGEFHGTKIRTNSLGLRGPELRDDGSVRILSTGDSCTWGWHVDEKESYPAVLERLLGERRTDRSFQVINAGVPGYTSFQGARYLSERGIELDPAIVIIGYGFNDMYESGNVEAQLERERLLMPFLRADDFVLNRSRLYRWARWKTQFGVFAGLGRRVESDDYARNLREMVRVASEHGARAMILSFWAPDSVAQEYRLAVIDVASELAVPLLTYEGPVLDVVHPTVVGYAAFTTRIADRLVAEGYLD